MGTKAKIWILVVVGLLLAIGGLVGVKALQIGTMINAGKTFKMPPESVTSAKVEKTDWRAQRGAIGTVVAVHGGSIASELPGRVTEILFDSGQPVRKGEDLVRLDTSIEQAQLQSALADQVLADQTLKRAQSLREHGSNTPADVEAAQAHASQAAANVAQLRATIAKKTIHAPYDGRVGIRQVEPGQIVGAGQTLATLQSVNPIFVEFWLPQQTLGELRFGLETAIHSDAFPSSTFTGRITTINPEIDLSTRNFKVRATVPNADGNLRPGMFVNVDVLSPDTRPTIIIPQTAVLYAPFGDSVFAVVDKPDADGKPSLTAQQKFVRLGERRGDYIAVDSGLEPGETIVSSGAFKLRNGVSLAIKNDLAPDVQTNPNPRER
ncbi:MAG: efflux RND transporter periplasmic adaptor subunit [Deltaproteobacteria bacterium]|nr:efflux RND transporter periplasmic adaptor subunit [Deltaproteobacteria bacterium]